MTTRQSGDVDGPRRRTTGAEVRQRGTTEQSGVDICTPGRPACTVKHSTQPQNVTSAPSLTVFGKRLKTHLFYDDFPSISCIARTLNFGAYNRSL